jgi:Threonine dehydratase
MTAELLNRLPETTTRSENALFIIDAYRDEFADVTTVSPIEMEFPYLEVDGKNSIYVLETGDNVAGTFKWRGALMGASALQQAGHERLVVPSAGNHARGAILAAKALGMSIDVVVPRTAPSAKREGLRELWKDPSNRVHVAGETFDESLAYAYEFASIKGGALLHPYDNEHVIRGQGTIVDDMLREKHDIDHILLPVGGGGLLAGVLDRLRELGREDVYVTAVEAPGSNSLSKSHAEKKISIAEAPNQAYGGSAVRYIGRRALHSAMSYSNLEVVTANQSDIDYVIDTYQQSRSDLMRTDKYFVRAFEPTSLVAVAGLYRTAQQQYENTVVIGTGHNAPLPIN